VSPLCSVPDPDPTFHLDADPDQDPDPAPRLHYTHVRKSDFYKKKIISSSTSYCCFSFLVSVKGVIIFNILHRILKFSGLKFSLALHLVEMDTNQGPEQDRQALDAHPDRENYADPIGSRSGAITQRV
jgi:hypothetical protein